MKTKKLIDPAFGLVLILLLISALLIVNNIEIQKGNDYATTIARVMQLKNAKIRNLSAQLKAKEKELATLKGQ